MIENARIELITLGDELLLGIRQNTHLAYLGQQLAQHGLTIRRNMVIRDREEEIERFFSQAWESSDIVLATGRLRPTVDDLTRETIAKALGLGLRHELSVEGAIRERYARMKRTVSENNLRQAKILEGAEVLPNRFGTAPGMWLKKDGKHLVMLPGPPFELYPMFESQVLPKLREEGIIGGEDSYLQVRTCGVGESHLETVLSPVFEPFGRRLEVAYWAHDGLVDVRLRSRRSGVLDWEKIREIGESCRFVLKEDFVGFGECGVAQMVLSQLRALGKTLAIAESCTGGLLANAFTEIPGAAKVFAGGVVCYTNDSKVQMLDVPEALLQQHGAVSAECSIALAVGAAEKFSADYALSVTGFVGPGGGTEEDPVGTIFLGYHSPVGVWSRKLVYPGNRLAVKSRAVSGALDWMRRKLSKYEVEDVLESMQT